MARPWRALQKLELVYGETESVVAEFGLKVVGFPKIINKQGAWWLVGLETCRSIFEPNGLGDIVLLEFKEKSGLLIWAAMTDTIFEVSTRYEV
ncbi:unnamed protein product [Dovyalis caffra]|uniref:Uncharacterized protein n=1 Tax=Dovyalis caffra TaxID=77055 RepID=A0AAV1RBL9_9ROSI|nr:unnamed protein product [Dovyalis caffra]